MWSGEFYTVGQALATIPDYLLSMPCGAFGIIRFMGGPLGKTKWYNGTVRTMLCDAALFESHTHAA